MTADRLVDTYRRHKLLVALKDGTYVGRVWREKEIVYETNGESFENVLDNVKKYIDSSFEERATARAAPPNGDEYLHAFQNILEDLSDRHCAMLKAHYHAPDQEITATQLAEAAGYSNYSAVNLQYGTIGKTLYEELPIDLEKNKDGTLIYTFVLATQGNREASEGQWIWKLRPEVAFAIKRLGLHT